MMFGRKKPLRELDVHGLRMEEIRRRTERIRLERHIKRIVKKKEKTFADGAGTKAVDLRRSLAQQFELLTTEQLMVARQLNVCMKESLVVSRLLMIRQNVGASLVGAVDARALEVEAAQDAAKAQIYNEMLSAALEASAIDQGEAGLTEAGEGVLRAWELQDAGMEADDAFDEADRATRDKIAAVE